MSWWSERRTQTVAFVFLGMLAVSKMPAEGHAGKLNRMRNKVAKHEAHSSKRAEARKKSVKSNTKTHAATRSQRRPKTRVTPRPVARPVLPSSRRHVESTSRESTRSVTRSVQRAGRDDHKLTRLGSAARNVIESSRPVQNGPARGVAHTPGSSRGPARQRFTSPRRPGRSPYFLGLQFGNYWSNRCPPPAPSYTIVEEHYYVDPYVGPVSTQESMWLSESAVPNVANSNEMLDVIGNQTNDPNSPSDYLGPSPTTPLIPERSTLPPVMPRGDGSPHQMLRGPGVAVADGATGIVTPMSNLLKPWHARLGIEYLGDVDDNVAQIGFDFLAHATAGFGVDADLRLFRERGSGIQDHLWIGDLNLIYELFPTTYVRPRAGIGLNWLSDQIGTEGGLNMTAGADLFLLNWLTVTAEADFGTLGDAGFFHANTSVGIRWSPNVEWYAGYDYFDIGGVQIESVVGGLRFRF